MTETIRIWLRQYLALIKATQESVENFPIGDEHIVVVDNVTLSAMLALLRFHPDEKAGKTHSEIIIGLLRGEGQAPQLKKPEPPNIIVTEPSTVHGDPLMDVLDIIVEYGKFLKKWKAEHQYKENSE